MADSWFKSWKDDHENNYFTSICSGSEEGSYLRLIDVCFTQLRPESKKQEEKIKLETLGSSPEVADSWCKSWKNETGSYLKFIDSGLIQREAQKTSRTLKESQEEESLSRALSLSRSLSSSPCPALSLSLARALLLTLAPCAAVGGGLDRAGLGQVHLDYRQVF